MTLQIKLCSLPSSCKFLALLDQGPSSYENSIPRFGFSMFADEGVTVVQVPETVRQLRGRRVIAVGQKSLEIRAILIEVSRLCNRRPVQSQRTLTAYGMEVIICHAGVICLLQILSVGRC
jgi:hypothetical protein